MSFLDQPGGLCAHFYEVVTPPDATLLAITADHLREVLRLDCDDLADDVAQGHIIAAEKQAEAFSGLTLFTTTFQLALAFFTNRIELRKRPIQSVTSISRRVEGADTTVAAEDYRLIQRRCYPFISLSEDACWPTDADLEDDAVTVTFIAGVADKEEDIPADIKAAITAIAVDGYENPGDCVTADMIPGMAKKILNPYRCLKV